MADINTSGSVRAADVALTSDVRFKKDIEAIDNVGTPSPSRILHVYANSAGEFGFINENVSAATNAYSIYLQK
jgi:hypothetical protein